MPLKAADQHRREKSTDGKVGRGRIGKRKKSDDESTVEKLKDKMWGLLHGDEDDDDQEKKKKKKKKRKKHGTKRRTRHRVHPAPPPTRRLNTTPTPGVAPTAASSNPRQSRTRRSLAWPVENTRDDPTRFTRRDSKVFWHYNWCRHPSKPAAALQFVPMQWDGGGIAELVGNVHCSAATVR